MSASAAPTTYRAAARRLLRDVLLDATGHELRRRRWAEVTMADIARAAGVSRQTLYKEFGSREALAQAFVLREGDRFLVAVDEAVRAHLDDPRAALSAAFRVFLTAAAEDPLVRNVIHAPGESGEGLLPLVTTQGQPLVERAAERLAETIRRGWPQVRPAEAALLAECLVRLAISYATLPKGSAQETAEALTTLLGPYLEEVLGEA